MKLRDSFNGGVRFEGDRALRWRSIPVNARIVSAKATVTPVDSKQGGPFAETLSFNGSTGDFGATKTLAGTWLEVDFNGRRTLASVNGSNLNPTTLQVDVGGGVYAEINEAGAFKTPSDPAGSEFKLLSNSATLPGLKVAKLKLTRTTGQPNLTAVTIRSVPSNVSLRVGELSPFYTRLGEITKPENTPDFATVLQAALATAKVENGFYDLPLVIHSDSIARLQVDLEVEFLLEQNPLPGGLAEVVLPFDASTLPQSTAALLKVEVPPNMRVVPGQTTARVRGSFAPTRIAYGPTGSVTQAAAVEVSTACSQAQWIALDTEIAAVAIDLLIAPVTRTVRLQLDLRGDLDGKPDDDSLLSGAVEFKLDQETGKQPRWVTVALAAEFLLAEQSKKRYWLVLQSLEGAAAWSVDSAKAGQLNMQCTRDGGLSWRDTIAMANTLQDKTLPAAGPFASFFRLRYQPKNFQVPIELQVGDDENAVRVKLDRFQPLGRVDFTLDTELAQGFNQYLAKKSASACPETEHLLNRNFDQWLRVGDDLITNPDIPIQAPIQGVAFAPDGTVAYVLDQLAEKPGLLLVIDAACNELVKDREIPLAISDPTRFVVSPDGTRAYVTNGVRLEIVNLVANEAIANTVNLADMGGVLDLALSPDGKRLYLAALNVVTIQSVTTKHNRIRAIDTAKLEQQLIDGVARADLQTENDVPTDSGQEQSPAPLAVSPDGRLLYLVTDRGTSSNAVVQVLNTSNFAPVAFSPIAVGRVATAIALTPDGKLAVVTNFIDNTVSVIDTVTGLVSASPTVDPRPVGVAVSPDGAHGYVLHHLRRSISIVDLKRQTVIKNFKIVPPPDALAFLALSPEGNQIYVAKFVNTNDILSYFISPIQFGKRLPAEWQVTSGGVSPFCLPPPFHLVAILNSESMPTALSQVVPVVESCPYEFNFWGIAWDPGTNEPPAMAEVLWRNNNCGLLRSDSVPIKLLPEQGDATSFNTNMLVPDFGGRSALSLHRLRMMAPAGANQAEVRFSTPTRGAAVIDRISLMATSEVTANGDFSLEEEGQLAGWTLPSGVAPGFAVLAAEDGVQLRNAGPTAVELVQTVAVNSGSPFTLEFRGKAAAGPTPEANPHLELRWFKSDQTPTGSPTVLEIASNGLSSSVASETAPADATEAEIHLVIPPRTTQEVRSISLRFSRPMTVPVTFIAQAPGELTVSDVRVAFEELEPQAPRVPARGLCKTTPPGCEPGEKGDSCFCHQCEEETVMVDSKPVMTGAGRPATMARCSACGTEVLSAGGPIVADAESLALRQSMASRPVVVRTADLIRPNARFQVAAEAPRLTDIRGIGEARAKQLTDVGIDSVEKLAASTPESVAKIKFITPRMASQIIAQAKSRLTGS